MALTRILNGQVVPLTQKEEADIRAEWAANDAAAIAEQQRRATARQQAIAKLQSLGLTPADIRDAMS